MFSPGKAYPEHYKTQLQEKVDRIKHDFAAFDLPEVSVFESPPSHYRFRAEFKIWKQQGRASYVMFDPKAPKDPIEITEFSIGSKIINALMGPLLEEINQNEILRERLFQVEFLSATTGEILTTLIYHRPLDNTWQECATALSKRLNTKIIGRSKGQKLVLEEDYIFEEFEVLGRTFKYQQVETGFTQPNATVCTEMLNWAVEVCAKPVANQSSDEDLLELYCGNGNFTLPLSQNFRNTLATEISKTSVASARYNMKLNKINNIEIARMSSEEFTDALQGVREFRRLKDIDLTSYNFSTVFVDPPRAGLDANTLELVKDFKNIIYISCNPDTLAKNLEALHKSHKVTKFAVFDQFPYTHHIECGAYLEAR